MTTKSSVHNIKSRLPHNNSVNNMSTNGNDIRPSRISVKRSLKTANFLQNNSTTNGFSNRIKKRTLQLNNFFNSKSKSNHSNEQTNGCQSTECPASPPIIFHAIAPASPEETNNLSNQANIQQETQNPPKDLKESNNEPLSPTNQRIANVFAHAKIETIIIDNNSIQPQSSHSEDDEKQSKYHRVLSIDADADESDNGNNKKINKSRRLQKTRKTSTSSISQKNENNSSNDEQQQSSSNDDENNERRTRLSFIKKSDPSISTPPTTDDDINKEYRRYHPLDNLESKLPTITTTTNESNLSSPIPTVTIANNQPSVKKINRFQVKSIRKSQQQQILLANATAAKSSNDDDYSTPYDRSNLHLQPSIIDRKHTNTPTTDGEHSTTNIDNIVNSAASALNTIDNRQHHVHFDVTPHRKQESTTEGEKSPSRTAATVTLPTPAPSSTIVSAQREDDEEEEAIAKSPDNRYIKYAKEIGRGAFKTVYRGLDTEINVAVAWCELQDFAQFDKHERTRFKEEAEMLKKLQHPNIVRFYDFWEETNPRTNKKVIILVTELMTSGSLKGYIRKFKGQTEEKRINVMKKWCRQILKGLAYLHSRNPPVIHRDLKCDNVFVSSTTGCVKIGDLGLATFKTQTFAKSMRGTMEFMAPEMFDEKYDELVDIYSFGLCMLEMITGEYPYIECKGPTAVIKRVTAGLKPDCYYKVENEDVKEVVDCCIRTRKEERLPVNELLQHSFFLDDNGLRVDLIRDPSNDSQVMVTNNSVDLKLKIVDKTKRKALWTEHEALRFRYNLTTDTAEKIANELIEKKYIFDEDKKFVIQSIKDRLRAYQYEQIDREAGVFSRNGKAIINQAPPPQQQRPITPVIALSQIASALPIVPTPSVIQQPVIEVQQQIIKPSSTGPPQTKPVVSTELPQAKPVALTEPPQAKVIVSAEPIPIPQLSELSSNLPASAGSLEVLDAALKKTLFNKNNMSQSTGTIPTITNDSNETPTLLINQDDSSISKPGNETTLIDQQPKEESVGIIPDELATNTSQFSTSSITQTQSQPTTMLTSHQQQILKNPLLMREASQSFSYSTLPPPQHLTNTTLSNDSTKQLILPSSSSATALDTIENSHLSTSPSHANEIPSDISSTTQPSISGSLKELDALLTNTFKSSNKNNGTGHNSDTETTIPLTINDENSRKSIDIESDLITKSDETKQKFLHLFNTSNPPVSSTVQSQPNIPSLIVPKAIQQIKSQPTSQMSTNFDPLLSPERNLHEFEPSIKTPHDRSLSSDGTIVSSSSNDLSEIKLMIMELNKTVINRMNIIENKIDEHRFQTIQINNLLTKTVLPSLIDLADIIHETPNLDSRVRTKLEDIQMNIRTTQQQTEMKDLMEI